MTAPDAPEAPGRLGEPIPAPELLTYLGGLDAWLTHRRTELDRLDAAAQASPSTEQYTADVLLAMTMWQAIRTRADELLVVWDSGRADVVDREKMSRLVWGRLDSGLGSALVSLVEAVTLCDAMIAKVRARLSFDPDSADQAERFRGLRAGLVRCEDLAGTDVASGERVAALRKREQKLVTQAARGADVTGPLGELETEAARAERDLIVQVSQRRTFEKGRGDAQATLAALETREPTLHELADRCRREIANPPKQAVPDVSRLGTVPDTRQELDAFVDRLAAVARAFDAVADAYSAPLRERAELRYRLTGAHAAADTNGRSASPTVRSGYEEAHAAVTASPCDVTMARYLVDQYLYLTRDLPTAAQEGIAMTAIHCTEIGCDGFYEDGWCNVCGSPQPAGSAPVSATTRLGTGVTQATSGGATGDEQAERSTRTGRTSSSRLATAALGSARTVATGSRPTRRVGTSSTRLRGARLGAGLTTVPAAPVQDPLQAVMAVAEVPERKRFCPSCGTEVGRTRGDVPGRTAGFCPQCGNHFDFAPALAPGDVVGGQYEVVGCLAHGGLGWIYLARDRNVSGRWVVLKGLLNSGDPDAYAAAISERQFLAEVEHPLIVEIYNFAMHDGAGYTVMEFVGGRSLKQILQDRRDAHSGVNDPLPVDQALAFVLEILPAFAYLHDIGLLFCDFKPDNVIQQGDSVKLIDLGGVRRIDDLTSAIFGTVGYQAPEVPEVGPSVASDIYTIGRTLATLVLDFRGNTSTFVASLPSVSDTPVFQTYDSFYRLLAKACALDPSDRFGSVDELRAQVLGVLREVVATDRGAGSPALYSAASVHFEAPASDEAGHPLAWDQLPALKVDAGDVSASWLSGVNVSDPAQRLSALDDAPEDSVEVRLRRASTAIEAGRQDVLSETLAQVLAEDPWEWRAAWIGGLSQLANGDPVAARASFNAVYGQVPGELAPKLALATACERSDEPEIAESLYVICARSDSNYTAPAAFGLARIRSARGDLTGALHALDLVTSTRSSYVDARMMRARLLAQSTGDVKALSEALTSVQTVVLPPMQHAELRVDVLTSALDVVVAHGPVRNVNLDGIPAHEPELRDALEGALRQLATLTEDHDERIALVDRAHEVRRWTTW